MRWARPAQLVVFGSAAVFVIVLVTHAGTARSLGEVSDWIPSPSKLASSFSSSINRGSLKNIMEKSEKIWQKTVEQRRAIVKQVPDLDFFPAFDGPSYFAYPFSVWDLIPASFNCPWEIERIGRMGDGGKWVCGMSRYEKNSRPCIIYSFGVQNESSFEQEMLERTNCEIWGYDFSVDKFGPQIKPQFADRTHFTKAGIDANTNLNHNPPFYSIHDLMEMNGHDYIDVLKIDIEYSEYNAISTLIGYIEAAKKEFPIGQMLIELHLFKAAGITCPIFLAWWESLEYRGWRATWTEPNLLAVTLKFEDTNPRLAEYTLVNVKDKRSVLFS